MKALVSSISVKTMLFVLSCLCLNSFAFAQLDDVLERGKTFRLFAYSTSQSQQGFEFVDGNDSGSFNGDHTEKFSSWGIGFEFRRERAYQGEASFWYENRFINDFMTTIWKHIANSDKHQIDAVNDYPVTGGLLGEFGVTWNVVSDDAYRVALGGCISDHFLNSRYVSIPNNNNLSAQTNDLKGDGLAGSYLGFGPCLALSYAINDQIGFNLPLSLQVISSRYSSGGREPLPTYFSEAKPTILNLGFEVLHASGFYLGMDMITPMSKHPTNLSRLDFNLGYRFGGLN